MVKIRRKWLERKINPHGFSRRDSRRRKVIKLRKVKVKEK